MAYALLAGMDPIEGLWAASVPLLAYSALGTSRVQSVGPTAMVGILSYETISNLLTTEETENHATYAALATVVALIAGCTQLLMGFARSGVLVNFLSFSVLSGFTSAAAIIIGLSQLKYIFGIEAVSADQNYHRRRGFSSCLYVLLYRIGMVLGGSFILFVVSVSIYNLLKSKM